MKLAKILILLLTITIIVAPILQPSSFVEKGHAASPGSVVISEIAWMGTIDANKEWIELYNNTSSPILLDNWMLHTFDNAPSIILSGTIPAFGYYLLERGDDNTIISVAADQVYTDNNLENGGEILYLKDNFGNIIDQVDTWYAGDNTLDATMERVDSNTGGNVSTNWVNSTSLYEGGFGTPKALNSSSNSPNPNRKMKASPIQLSEITLNGNIIALNLQEESFAINVTPFIILNNPPPGTTIGSVERYNDQSVHVTLSYDGTNFDVDITNFSITVVDNGLVGSGDLTSNSITVKAMNTVEGSMGYNSTGTSYPTKIEMAGYNIRNKSLYINSTLHTEKNVTGKTATFHYFITIYDGLSNKIGNLGDITTPLTKTANIGVSDVELKNVMVTLTQDLPAAYRIVIVVKMVDIN